jgi:hypothetical protein
MQELKIKKEFKDLIPPLADHEKAGLEEDIKHFGCYCPIVTWNSYIIDGHHRYEICMRHKLSFRVEEKTFEKERDVRKWIIKNQFNRRNLTDFVRGELALAYKGILQEEAEEASIGNLVQFQVTDNKQSTECQNFDTRRNKTQKERNESRVNAQIGDIANISREQVRKIEKLKACCNEKEIKDLRSGKVKIHKKFTEKERGKREQTLKATEFPQGKYRIIYADPPWDYGKGVQEDNGAEEHYPVMSLDSLCEMPIKQITDENAVLFIWVTSPMLLKSFRVIESWGFTYKSMFIWDKVKHNMGYYNSVRHELLLICTIVIWNGYIIDGHHRYEICSRHKLTFKTEEREFKTQNDAEVWIIQNQFNCRNLPLFTRGTLVFELEKRFNKRHGNRHTCKEIPRARRNRRDPLSLVCWFSPRLVSILFSNSKTKTPP